MIYRDVPDVQTNVVCFTKVWCARCAERCLIYRVVLDVQNGVQYTLYRDFQDVQNGACCNCTGMFMK